MSIYGCLTGEDLKELLNYYINLFEKINRIDKLSIVDTNNPKKWLKPNTNKKNKNKIIIGVGRSNGNAKYINLNDINTNKNTLYEVYVDINSYTGLENGTEDESIIRITYVSEKNEKLY